ncbi:L-alanine-DL-glutamate epimerase-like enolase superfamily enzyme [Sinorhizobium fredii]
MTHIVDLRVYDLRFPTSQSLDGSDAMNPDPDYSAAYVILDTDRPGLAGHGLTFTIGRGNDICCMAIKAMRHLVVGQEIETIRSEPGRFWRHLTDDSQLRWIGPEKGAIHLATGAIVNAVWDLIAKEAGKPVWRLVAEMSVEEIVDIVDYRYLTDVLTREEAIEILKRADPGKAERIATLEKEGYPCYTTSAGWLGYDDAKLRRLAQEAVRPGLQSHQDEGRARPRRRYPPADDRPRGDRSRPLSDDRRQPGLGGQGGDRLGEGAGLRQALLHRGADEP